MEYKKPFTSLKEAQKVVDELNALSPRNAKRMQGQNIGFCPLINCECRKDCVCYRIAKVAESEVQWEIVYDVLPPRCSYFS